MKLKIIVTVLLLFGLVLNVSAAGEKNFASINSLNMLVGLGTINYDMKLDKTDNKSLVFKGAFGSYKIGDWSMSITGLGAGLNIWPKKEPLSGAYFGPRAELLSINAKYKYDKLTGVWPWTWQKVEEEASSTFIGLGVDFGYRWIWDGGFGLGIVTGLKFVSGDIEIADKSIPISGGGWSGLALNLGYAW